MCYNGIIHLNKKSISFRFLFFFHLIIISKVSFSCDCIIYPIDYYVEKSGEIFTGKVVELLKEVETIDFIDTPENREYYKDRSYLVKVLVMERLKMNRNSYDTLEFTSEFSNCDPLYRLNETYLFFANKMGDGLYKMEHCSPWGELSKVQNELSTIKEILSQEQIPINKVIGKWTIYQTLSSNTDSIEEISTCNECPTITFYSNHTSVLDFPDRSIVDSLSWNNSYNTIFLKEINPRTKFPYFYSGKYKMILRERTDYLELHLKHEGQTYVLRR